MQSNPRRAETVVVVFTVVNFVLAGLCAVWLLLIAAVLVYGIVFSGDEGEELAAGLIGTTVIGLPALVGLGVYSLAGLGLMWHRRWGYYLHCAGAILAALTCVGLIYTVPALVFAFRPEFSAISGRRNAVEHEW